MRVFVDSWRQSLAAAALAAILAPAMGDSAQTFAAEARQPNPAMVREGEGEKPAAREATKEQTPAARKQREEIAAQSREERKELEPRKPQARREQRREAREEPREKAAEAAKPQPEGERSDATLRQMMERRRQLEKEAMEIRRRLEALKPDREALERIEAQLSQLQRPGAPMPGGPVLDRERRAQAEAQLADLAAAIKRAREADKPEEVERIEQQYRDLARQLLRRPSDAGFPGRPFDVLRRPPGGMPGGAIQNWPTFEGGDIERRLQHVRTAVENLRAAGLHDQAEAVAREAERLIREQPTPPMPGAPLGPPPGPPAAKDAFPGAGPPPPAQHLERAVDELREQMQQMQRQMEEIRRDLRAIAERSQKDK
jgi:DNA repair exonuclease SbcCD ATPase subunit